MNPILSPRDDRALDSSPVETAELPNFARNQRHIPPNKKISTACSGCKKRKTRCSGKVPCTQCIQRGTIPDCLIDSTTDLRRKGVSDRRLDELENDRLLLDNILETLRISTEAQLDTFVHLVRGDAAKSDLASYVRSFLRQSDTIPTEPIPNSSRHRPVCSIHDILNHDPDLGPDLDTARSQSLSPLSSHSPPDGRS